MDFLISEPIVKIAGVELIVMLALAVVSAIASILLTPKAEGPISDRRPPPQVKMGGFISYWIGRRRVGPTICWVGGHWTRKKKSGGGKDAIHSIVHREQAVHALLVGEAYALHGIYANGKKIFAGPITSETHPSGTSVNYGRFTMTMYWGESNQPIDPDVAEAIGINSSFPGICYAWISKFKLGGSRQWPLLYYDLEVRPTLALSGSDAWIEDSYTINGNAYPVTAVNNGAAGTAYIEVAGKKRREFSSGSTLILQGGNPADGNYVVWLTTIITTTTLIDGKQVQTRKTRIILNATLAGATVSGTIDGITLEEADGANPAHVLNQILFGEWPSGLGLSDTLFDSASMISFGALIETEDTPCSVISSEGETARALIGTMMQDFGLMLSWNIREEAYEWIPQRAPVGALDTIPESLIRLPLPEIDIFHGEYPASRLVFTFSDRTLNFMQNTVTLDNDAQAGNAGHVAPREIEIPTVVNSGVARVIANRRAQEELGQLSVFSVVAAREARLFRPGTPLSIFGLPFTVRLLAVQFQDGSGDVHLDTVVDSYGSGVTTLELEGDGSARPEEENEYDEASAIYELPEYLNRDGVVKVITPRIRANEEVVGADIFISSDDVTYDQLGEANSTITGGELIDAMTVNDPWFIDEGPTFTVQGPDIDEVEDLSADADNWRKGRQVCLIGDEIFFLKKVTAISATVYRLDGLIRARYDTVIAVHSVGAPVFIFNRRDIPSYADELLFPGDTVYFKLQSFSSDAIDLDDIESLSHTVHGKGVVPMDPENLRTENMRNEFSTGEDVPLKWAYRSGLYLKTGAGMQGAGNPTPQSPIDGEFIIRLLTTGDVLKHEISAITVASLTLDNADLVTWFGAEPAGFKVQLTVVKAGFESNTRTITITRV